VLLIVGGTGCTRAPTPPDVGFVTSWTRLDFGLARAERLSPPVASRIAAYAAVALYQGWATGSDSCTPKAYPRR
jgi:hypothetical protein